MSKLKRPVNGLLDLPLGLTGGQGGSLSRGRAGLCAFALVCSTRVHKNMLLSHRK